MKCSKCWLHDLPAEVCLDRAHRVGIACGEKDTICRAMRVVLKMARRLLIVGGQKPTAKLCEYVATLATR